MMSPVVDFLKRFGRFVQICFVLTVVSYIFFQEKIFETSELSPVLVF